MRPSHHDLFCETCNILVSAKVVATAYAGATDEGYAMIEVEDTEYHGDHYTIALCPRCKSPFLIREVLYGIPGEFETITDTHLLYPKDNRLSLAGIPESVRRAYEQASLAFHASLFEPCALMCRRCLEALCKEQGAHGANLNLKLESLEKNGAIDARMIKWAHGVRILGNDAAHDVDTVISMEDARDVLDFTESLLIYIFELNNRFSAFLARRSKP